MADAFPEAGPLGEARPKARHPAVRALSNRPFRLFFIGNLISQTGTFLQSAALAVLVFDLTGTNAAVGLTNAATFLPVLALALVGGELADRFNRRRLFLVTQVVSTIAVAALAALTAAGRVTPGWIYALAGVLGLCYAVAIPTMHSLIPSLVPPADLGPSIGLTSVTFNAARIIGPAVASAAIAGLGFAGAFGLNALSFVPMIVALALIRVTPRAADRPRVSLVEGVRYAWREPAVRGMLLAVASISFAFDPVMTLAPGFARRVFGHSGAAAPVLMAAFGVGSVLSAAFLGRMFRRPEANVRRGSATLFLLGAGMAGFALSPTFEVGVAMLLVAGLGSLSSVTLFTTGLQQIVSEDVRGRVMAMWTVCALGARFPAGLVDGFLADALGPRVAALSMLLPLALVATLSVPRLPVPGGFGGVARPEERVTRARTASGPPREPGAQVAANRRQAEGGQ